MSDIPGAISRKAITTPGADYLALRTQAVGLTQAMSHDIWTDYNFSDPGVTIIEQLCYALTELPYRADLPVQDLLCGPGEAGLQLRRQGLFPAWSILPCNPVVANDLRRLVIDRVPGVANAWFTPRMGADGRRPSGLYDVAILAEPKPDGRSDAGGRHRYARHHHPRRERDRPVHDPLIDRLLRCYAAHRALCEDVRVVRVLRPLDTRIHARITLQEQADPSDTLAQAFFQLALTLAPEPRRMSLQEQMLAKPASTDVFTGPLMLRGFIADDQLAPLPHAFTVDSLVEALAETAGVLAVDQFAVELAGDPARYGPEDTVPVPRHSVLHLNTKPREGRFPITMVRNRSRCEPDPARVRLRLAQLWRQQRRTYPLRTEYAAQFGTPPATHWALHSYMSVQNQFPIVYGIGAGGLPPSPTTARRGLAKQLKGYLMPFDQMLADYFAQLAFLRDLFSVESGGAATYAWQSLRPIVPDAMPLLAADYEAELARLNAETDPVDQRRNGILDLLLAFYGLTVAMPEPLEPGATPSGGPDAALIRAKQLTLRRAAAGMRDRGRGMNPRRAGAESGMTGVEARSRVQLGLLDVAIADSHDAATGPRERRDGPIPVDESADTRFGRMLPRDVGMAVDRYFRPVDDDFNEMGNEGPDSPSHLAGRHVALGLLSGLHDRSRYRIGRLREPDRVWLVCRDPNGSWWLIAQFGTEGQAVRALRDLVREATWHYRRAHRRRLYVVEWVLLRHARVRPRAPEVNHDMRITAVLSETAEERDSAGWRSQATTILRDNTPAHVAMDVLFLGPWHMERFEWLYGAWTTALRQGLPHHLAETSTHLARFLQRHTPTTAPSGGQDQPDTPAATDAEADAMTVARIVAGATPSSPAAPTAAVPVPPTERAPPASEPVVAAPVEPALPPVPPELASLPPSPSTETPTQLAGHSWLVTLLLAVLLWLFKPLRWLLQKLRPTAALVVPDAPVPAAGPAPAVPVTSPGAQPAPPGAVGFDADTVLTAATAAAFVDQGFVFAIRYLSRTVPEAAGDLSAAEATTIREAGLALMTVQHVRAAGWSPTRTLGQVYGAAAAANAKQVGLPAGVCVWLDLEGVASGTPATDISAYCNTWFQQVSEAGYLPGLYVGANCGLDNAQLGQLNCRYFWQSGSTVPGVTGVGYCMVQTIDAGFTVDGVAYDRDVVQADSQGETPVWAAPTTPVATA